MVYNGAERASVSVQSISYGTPSAVETMVPSTVNGSKTCVQPRDWHTKIQRLVMWRVSATGTNSRLA